MDRHHVRRRGDNMLIYIYAHRPCHDAIETNLKWAVDQGFIVRDRDREKRYHETDPDLEHLL